MPNPFSSTQTLSFIHEEGKNPEVKTQIVKTMRARMGGKLTLSHKLTSGTGQGYLYIGKSRVHNPTVEEVDVILDGSPWTNNSDVLFNNELVTYPFLVVSADFSDNNAATVEVEITLSWNMQRG